jgi:hypothetical protein
MVLGWAANGIGTFVSTGDDTSFYGWAHLIDAIVQTIGALLVAMSDIDIDIFVNQFPMRALIFAIGWVVLYVGMEALSPPLTWANQVNWFMALPFLYLLLRYQSVLQMRPNFPRFTALVAYSLSLDIVATGMYFPIDGLTAGTKRPTLPFDLVGVYFIACGIAIFLVYEHELRKAHTVSSPTVALSITIYAYLLGAGTASLGG